MNAIARFCPSLLVVVAVFVAPAAASAQTSNTPYQSLFLVPGAQPPALDRAIQRPLHAALQQVDVPANGEAAPSRGTRRQRGTMTVMYAGLVTLQALDAHSTFRALDGGLAEWNPVMRWASQHPVALVSLKAGATAVTVFASERIRKKHPKRAMAFMLAINAAYALVVVRNYHASPGAR